MNIRQQTTTEKPYCHVLTPRMKEERCDQCFINRKEGGLKRCSQCKVVRYCSAFCQKLAWILHKEECPALKRVAPKVPTDSVLLLFRLLILQKNDENTVKQNSIFGDRCFQELMSHTAEIKQDSKRMEEFCQVMGTLNTYTQDIIELPSAVELLEIFGKVCINSFTICDQEMQPLGVGIYLGASNLDHSCAPNAVPTFCGVNLQISRTDGSTFQNSQTLISYTDQLNMTSERQEELRERYYFTCDCSRCQDITQDEEKWTTVCPTLNCTGVIRQAADGEFRPCSACNKAEFGNDYMSRKKSITKEAKETLQQLKVLRKSSDYQEILTRSKACLSQCSGFLPPSNIQRCQLEDQALDACIELGLWHDALEFGKTTLYCYRKFYDQFHPNLGIQLMKMGKIALYLKQLSDASRYLQEAESVIRVSHTADHPLYKDLTELLDQCLEEQRMQLKFKGENTS